MNELNDVRGHCRKTRAGHVQYSLVMWDGPPNMWGELDCGPNPIGRAGGQKVALVVGDLGRCNPVGFMSCNFLVPSVIQHPLFSATDWQSQASSILSFPPIKWPADPNCPRYLWVLEWHPNRTAVSCCLRLSQEFLRIMKKTNLF